jgi:glycosyltransferase involved in cell wall biosynthesis
MLKTLLIHPADSGGCYYYRLAMPARALVFGKRAEAIAEAPFYLPLDDFKGKDETPFKGLKNLDPTIIMVQRQFSDGQFEEIQKYRELGFKVVHDLDDYLWKVPAGNPFINAFSPKNRKNLSRVVTGVDGLTVSTEPLAEGMRKMFGQLPKVVPNFISNSHFKNPRERPLTRKLRVGWAGSPTHTADLAPLFSVIRDTQDIYDWNFLGWHPQGIGEHITFHPAVKVEDYMTALAEMDLDVAIAPLEDNFFNECKSHLKLLEFSALGMPVICSDVYPYQESPGKLVKPRAKQWKDWAAVLADYASDEELRMKDAWLHYVWATHFTLENPKNIDVIEAGWAHCLL